MKGFCLLAAAGLFVSVSAQTIPPIQTAAPTAAPVKAAVKDSTVLILSGPDQFIQAITEMLKGIEQDPSDQCNTLDREARQRRVTKKITTDSTSADIKSTGPSGYNLVYGADTTETIIFKAGKVGDMPIYKIETSKRVGVPYSRREPVVNTSSLPSGQTAGKKSAP